MEETGTLPVGIDHGGQVCTQFVLREQIVADGIEVLESTDAERAVASDAFYGVCIMAKRLRVTGIPEVTTQMVMGMNQLDFDALHKAEKRLDQRRLEFRGQGGDDAPVASGSVEAGDSLGADPGHAGGDGGGVSGGSGDKGDRGAGKTREAENA